MAVAGRAAAAVLHKEAAGCSAPDIRLQSQDKDSKKMPGCSVVDIHLDYSQDKDSNEESGCLLADIRLLSRDKDSKEAAWSVVEDTDSKVLSQDKDSTAHLLLKFLTVREMSILTNLNLPYIPGKP